MTPEDFLEYQLQENRVALKLMSFFLNIAEITSENVPYDVKVKTKQNIVLETIKKITDTPFEPSKEYDDLSLSEKEDYLDDLVYCLLK